MSVTYLLVGLIHTKLNPRVNPRFPIALWATGHWLITPLIQFQFLCKQSYTQLWCHQETKREALISKELQLIEPGKNAAYAFTTFPACRRNSATKTEIVQGEFWDVRGESDAFH